MCVDSVGLDLSPIQHTLCDKLTVTRRQPSQARMQSLTLCAQMALPSQAHEVHSQAKVAMCCVRCNPLATDVKEAPPPTCCLSACGAWCVCHCVNHTGDVDGLARQVALLQPQAAQEPSGWLVVTHTTPHTHTLACPFPTGRDTLPAQQCCSHLKCCLVHFCMR